MFGRVGSRQHLRKTRIFGRRDGVENGEVAAKQSSHVEDNTSDRAMKCRGREGVQ